MKRIITLDSSNIVRSMNCKTDWFYHNHLGLAAGPKRDYTGASPIMEMGTYGHKLLERYYASPFKAGKDGKIRLLDAIAYAQDFDPNQETCICGHHRDYHKVGVAVDNSEEWTSCQHCTVGDPIHEFKPIEVISLENQKRVQKRFQEYCYLYTGLEDFRFPNPESLEVGFSKVLFEDDKYLFIAEGRIDGLPFYRSQHCFIDHKFQEKKRNLNTRSIQFRTYGWAAEVPMGYINYIRLTAEPNGETFYRVPMPFTRMDHEMWKERLIQHFKSMADFMDDVENNGGIPPMKHNNDANCMGQFSGMCSYRNLCDQGGSEFTQILIDTNYHTRQVWKPW